MYWVSWRMAARSERKAQPPRSSSVAMLRSFGDVQDDGLQCGEHAQAGASGRAAPDVPRRRSGLRRRPAGRQRRWRLRRCRACRRGRRLRPDRQRERGKLWRMPCRGGSDEGGALIQRFACGVRATARWRQQGPRCRAVWWRPCWRGARGAAGWHRCGRSHVPERRRARHAAWLRRLRRRLRPPIPGHANRRRRRWETRATATPADGAEARCVVPPPRTPCRKGGEFLPLFVPASRAQL